MKWLKIPTSTVGRAMFFGSTELLTFFIITANFRAIALGNYFWAGLTDYLTVLVNFGVGKLMMDDAKYHTWWIGIGFATGGTIGTLLSIWMTKHLYGR